MKEIIREFINTLKQHRHQFDYAAKIQMELWNGNQPKKHPLLLTCPLDKVQDEKIPSFNTMQTHFDSEKMFLSGLREIMTVVNGGCEAVPSMRANMGCGIFPTLFGLKQQLFDDKMPWVKEHLSKEVLSKMSPEDIKIGDEFRAGLEHMSYIADLLKDTGCMVFPMDLQGVYDTAHIVYGDQIFYDMYDDPDFIHHLLELSCHAICIGMDECLKIMPDSSIKVAHYNSLVMPRIKGGIKLSEDTSTLLSKSQIDEFVAPYIKKVLNYFGGGYIHYCGTNPHLFESVMNEPLAYGLNFGNPEKHDMEYVLKRCAQKNKIFYGTINKEDGFSYGEYFKKYLTASKQGNRYMLLLQFSCSLDERADVHSAWENTLRCL